MLLTEGKLAPDFELLDEGGVVHKLSDYRGTIIVLYFYPKDDTPGCTKEACSFRDSHEIYYSAGIKVVGISPDSPQKHAKFKEKYSLPFTLLADEDHRVCISYGVWGRKKYMGKEYDGVLRTTYIIDANGFIQKVFPNVKPEQHSQEILTSLTL